MTKWTIKSNGTQIGTSTNETFSYAFNENMSSKDITYTIEAEDNNGCKASMDTKLPKCTAKISLISIECKNTTSSKKSDSVLLVTVSLDKARSEDIEMSASITAQNITHSANGPSTTLHAGETQITLEVPGYYPSLRDDVANFSVMALVYVSSSDITITNQRLEGTYVLPNCTKEESIPTINLPKKEIQIINQINYINFVQISGSLVYKEGDEFIPVVQCYKKDPDGKLNPVGNSFSPSLESDDPITMPGYIVGHIISGNCEDRYALKSASGPISFANADVFKGRYDKYISSADEIYLRLEIGANSYMILDGSGKLRSCEPNGYVTDVSKTEFDELDSGNNTLISKNPIPKIDKITLVQSGKVAFV